ncbi:MAG TPA: extracellular solute-binding protein, partial [Planctomycetota bacterium]|nr:extracellular solute-binding protein [Planctomycetota bacterium]
MRKGWLAAVAAAVVLAAVLPGCGREDGYDLVIMSPHDEKITEEFETGFAAVFEAKYGRKPRISWRDLGTGTEGQMRYILETFERRPEGIDVDVFFGGGMDPFRELKAKGYLIPHRPPNADAIPEKILGVPLRDADDAWWGAALSSFGILYNRPLLERLGVPEPKTWEDLADPRLMGYVGLADPSKSGSARAIYEIILQARGWDEGLGVITRLAANAREFYTGSGSVVRDVALGEVAAGPAIDFYGWTQVKQASRAGSGQAGADRLGFVLPAERTVITPDSIGILKGAPHPEVAKMFVDFVLSEAGQKLWMLKAGTPGGPRKYDLLRMSVLPAVYGKYAEVSNIRLNPFTFTSRFTHDAIKGSDRRVLVADLMKST